MRFRSARGGDLEGVIDVVRERAMRFDAEGRAVNIAMPLAMRESVSEARNALFEVLASGDDAFMALWAEDAFSADDVDAALRRGTASRRLVPTLCGSALANVGVPPLLDAIVDFLPAPEDVGTVIDAASGRSVHAWLTRRLRRSASRWPSTTLDRSRGCACIRGAFSGVIAWRWARPNRFG